MAMHNNLSEIEARCTEIINSPYMRRELPPELLKLRVLLTKVEKLTREDVPSLVSEIKRLRSQNKRLEAEAEASQLTLEPEIEAEVIDLTHEPEVEVAQAHLQAIEAEDSAEDTGVQTADDTVKATS
ncbi:MAG: hypothetical protein ABI670_12605 [Chloroflexota bacterium]